MNHSLKCWRRWLAVLWPWVGRQRLELAEARNEECARRFIQAAGTASKLRVELDAARAELVWLKNDFARNNAASIAAVQAELQTWAALTVTERRTACGMHIRMELFAPVMLPQVFCREPAVAGAAFGLLLNAWRQLLIRTRNHKLSLKETP